jgi:hypothetical protein
VSDTKFRSIFFRENEENGVRHQISFDFFSRKVVGVRHQISFDFFSKFQQKSQGAYLWAAWDLICIER